MNSIDGSVCSGNFKGMTKQDYSSLMSIVLFVVEVTVSCILTTTKKSSNNWFFGIKLKYRKNCFGKSKKKNGNKEEKKNA